MSSTTVNANLTLAPNPLDVDLGFTVGGTVGVNANATLNIPTLPKITIGLDPIQINPLSLEIKPLDINLAVTRLPLIDIQFGFRPMRFHFPMNMKLAICALGKEVLSFGTCGESMLVIEDYVPHQRELCS
jgi:hypothetical protein